MVTAEFAIGLITVALVVVVISFAAGIGVTFIQTQEAARQGARLIARGEPASKAREQAQANLPRANVKVMEGIDTVTVEVSSTVKLPLANLNLGSFSVSSSSHSTKESDE